MTLPSYPNTWNRETLAWAAGFFDGEGSLGVYYDKRDNRPFLQLNISQKDRRPLAEIAALFGFGNIRVNQQGVHYWTVYTHEKVQHVVATLWPFMRVKREQAADVFTRYLEAYKAYPHQRIVTPGPGGRWTWKDA
jgi:hypothetical protein